MTPQKNISHAKQGSRLIDEVYRQMYRLEEERPGADLDLALALLRAWSETASPSDLGEEERIRLKKLCPICLKMIEAAHQR